MSRTVCQSALIVGMALGVTTELSFAPIDQTEWEACFLEPVKNPEAERYLRKALRVVPPSAPYFFDSPWITRSLVHFDLCRLPLVHIGPDLAERIAMVVSQDNACRYCFAATRTVLKILGYSDSRIRRLEEDLLTAELDRPQQLAVEFARRVSHATPLATRADAAPLLAAGYSEQAVAEMTFFAALNVFYNRMATLPALPPEQMEAMGTDWRVRLLRPLVARMVRYGRRAQPQALPAERRSGPFAPFVLALDGLPVALKLREVLDESWASEILNRRVKALVFAVVARGLGCPFSEQEATGLLLAEGWTRHYVDRVLSDLGAPDLDPVENAVLPFARETIWYQPAHIQRRARALRQMLTRAQFVELIGVCALANAVCRLSAALDLARARQG